MDVPNLPSGSPAAVERKLVALLVCDVHERTAALQHAPKQGERLLAHGLGLVHAEVARHGGLVVEVVGSVLLAAFGVPRTREDDAERAVRTAFAIRARFARPEMGDWGGLRTAVAFGEALVRRGEPAEGGGWRISGEVRSTAFAVKDAAPPRAALVTAATLQATQRAITYAPAQLLPLAGAKEPVAVWEALAPRPRTGRAPAPLLGVGLVGREGELAILTDRYQRVRVGGGPQLVTLVGAAGIGKSRLVAELGHRVAAEAEPPSWRAGRVQPYVDGGTFGALVELAKAEAGILDSDPAATAERKLAEAVAGVMMGPHAAWVSRQLRPLVGASAPADAAVGGAAERGQDMVAAWRWFLRALADRQPLVLALEDLHGADQLLLDVVDGLVDPALVGQAPLLVVATARPELADRRPGWGTELPNRTTVTLGPLPAVDTARLLQALLVQQEVAARVDADLLARVAGNPLFAEEYARLLRDRQGQPGSLPVPATVQAVIAARLDGLPPEQKAVLADAAVVGQVAWVGAIAAVGGCDPADLDAWLHLNRQLGELERRELLGRVPGSRVAGEVEVAFRHVLVHEVAYRQLPRAARVDRHRRAASWLEGLAPDRTAERAELLAHHYTQALTYAKAAGTVTAEFVDRTRSALRDAGDHAARLGSHATAARHYAQTLELWPADDPTRPELELRAGEARCLADGSGEELLLQARDGLLASGNQERAAEAEVLLGQLAYEHAHGRERAAHVDRALALVVDRPPSPSKATVLRGCSWHLMVSDRHAEALPVAHEALAMARTLGLGHLEADALGIIGAARINLGDPGGLADLRRCVALCEELGSSLAVSWHLNLANSLSLLGDLHGSAAALAAARPTAERLGSARGLRWLELEQVADQYWSGRWDEAAVIADTVTAQAAGGARHLLEGECRIWRGRIRAWAEVTSTGRCRTACAPWSWPGSRATAKTSTPPLRSAPAPCLPPTERLKQLSSSTSFSATSAADRSSRTSASTLRSTCSRSATTPRRWIRCCRRAGWRRHGRLWLVAHSRLQTCMPRSVPAPTRPTHAWKRLANS
jgi:class 3 adenylate cyclase/tetratricopeptide (TPR) repeat protein